MADDLTRATISISGGSSGNAVEIQAPGSAIKELAALAHPFFVMEASSHRSEHLPTVIVSTVPPEGPHWRRWSSSSAYEPDRVLWLADTSRSIAVIGEPSHWRDQQVLRSVRHLLRWLAYASGDLLLHGGMVRSAGTGIAFVGGKRSGKTSSILSSLLHGADFVSNDDVTFTEGPDGRLIGYGFPRTVNVRTDSLMSLARSHPAMEGLLSGASHPTNTFEGRHRTSESITTRSGKNLPGSLWARSTELSDIIGCRVLPRSQIDTVVFPQFDDQIEAPRISVLDHRRAEATLSEHTEVQGTKYDPFLADWFPETDRPRRERLLHKLLMETSFLHLTQDMQNLCEATRALLHSPDLHRDGAGQGR